MNNQARFLKAWIRGVKLTNRPHVFGDATDPDQARTKWDLCPVYERVEDALDTMSSTELDRMGTAAYLRVSTSDQTVEHQRLQVTSAGIAPDRWFTDAASGRDGADRPGFREGCNWLREGDILVVVGVDRLGTSVREIAATLHELAEKGVALRSLREGVDTSTPTGRAIVSIMASVAGRASQHTWRRSPKCGHSHCSEASVAASLHGRAL